MTYGSSAALPSVHLWLNEVLDRVADGNRAELEGRTVRVHVIPRGMNLTEIPLWADKRGQTRWDAMRGVFRSCSGSTLDLAVGEELVTALRPTSSPDDYESPTDAELGRTLVHEIGHAVFCGLTPSQDALVEDLRAAAFDRYPTGVVGIDPAYTVSRSTEYFAEGSAAWFQVGVHSSYRRAWLSANDPGLYGLVDAVFAMPSTPRHCDGERATMVLPAGGATVTGPYNGGRDVVVGSSSRDIIDVGTGSDLVCAGGGDDVVTGGTSNDTLYGEAGNDDLQGGNNDDELFGGPGNDTYHGDGHDDWLSDSGGGGSDVMWGGSGDDVLAGGDAPDILVDDIGEDELIGGAGADWLLANDSDGVTPDSVYGDLNTLDTDDDACAVDPTDTVVAC